MDFDFRDKLPELPERAYKERTYSTKHGQVRYLNQKGLDKQLTMPRIQFYIMLVFAAVAVGIGVWLYTGFFNQVDGAIARTEQSTQDNLTREVSYDLPVLSNLVSYSDQDMQQSFVDAGLTTYLLSDASDVGSFNLAKLPADVSVEEAALMYSRGVARLGASDAAKLLKGSWTLYVDHDGGTSLRLRYADFNSGSVDLALDAAIAAQGFNLDTVGDDQGVDDAGNTYKAGTVIGSDGQTYTWRVSTLPLSEMYDISGLPSNAVYVGVRLSSQ